MKRTTPPDARYTATRRYKGLCIRAALTVLDDRWPRGRNGGTGARKD